MLDILKIVYIKKILVTHYVLFLEYSSNFSFLSPKQILKIQFFKQLLTLPCLRFVPNFRERMGSN